MKKLRFKSTTISPSYLACWGLFLFVIFWVFFVQKWTYYDLIVYDIRSYYAYLPATFIEGDLSLDFLNYKPQLVDKYYDPVYIENDQAVIKMSMGMSVLYLPYFLIGHLWAHIHALMDPDGFSEPYQIMLALSAPVHLLLGLMALRKVLLTYFKEAIVTLSLLLIVLSTNAFYYSFYEGLMSHVHNFMLIAFFLRLTQLWHDKPSWKWTILLGLVSGLIVLVRPNNVIVGLLFIFYNILDRKDLIAKAQLFWKHRLKLLTLLAVAFLVLVPQLVYWKYATGHWVYYSYTKERFFFDRPRFYLALFSYTKGWYVYTPIGLLATAGLFMLRKKAKAFAFILPIFIFLFMYIAFSWWSWWYGGSYSQRVMIDVYPIMAVGLAAFLSWGFQKLVGKIVLSLVLILMTSYNLFQTWQYTQHILHWDSMSKKTYWMIFLKTEQPKGFVEYLIIPNTEDALKGKVSYWNDYRKKE